MLNPQQSYIATDTNEWFEINLVVVLQDDHLISESFPIKGHWTSITSSPNFFQKSQGFYTVGSVGMGNDRPHAKFYILD